MAKDAYFCCPHCGEPLPSNATFCKHCGGSHDSGWENDNDASVDIWPNDDDEDYRDFLEREFPAHLTPRRSLWQRIVFLIALLLLVAFLYQAFWH